MPLSFKPFIDFNRDYVSEEARLPSLGSEWSLASAIFPVFSIAVDPLHPQACMQRSKDNYRSGEPLSQKDDTSVNHTIAEGKF